MVRVPRKANSAHGIRVKKKLPIFVSYLAERLWLDYHKIVHEDIGFGYGLCQTGHTLYFGLRQLLCEPPSRGVDALLSATIEDHRSACFGQAARDGEPDARS
jgi:hypothetical protein